MKAKLIAGAVFISFCVLAHGETSPDDLIRAVDQMTPEQVHEFQQNLASRREQVATKSAVLHTCPTVVASWNSGSNTSSSIAAIAVATDANTTEDQITKLFISDLRTNELPSW
jgi:hypothetical protein